MGDGLVKIANRWIGPQYPLFLVAELGITACGSLDRALKLVDAVAAAGADAAKFIVTDPEKTMSRRDLPFTYEVIPRPVVVAIADEHGLKYVPPGPRQVTRPLYDLLAECRFSFDDWCEIRNHCRARGVIFFATADYPEGVDLLESLDVPAHKLSCWDIAYTPLLAKMRATGKPVLVDVGTATAEEVLRAIPDEENILFVHDPHPPDWNMSRLRGFFRPDYPVGFSSPGRESWCDYVALGGGACLIEKRLTLRRDEPTGHHHAISLEPDEFSEWVRSMRLAEARLREDPWGGSEKAWQDRATYTRGPDGRMA